MGNMDAEVALGTRGSGGTCLASAHAAGAVGDSVCLGRVTPLFTESKGRK